MKMRKGMKMINQKIVTLLAVFSLFISSCNSTKYLAENERLYDGGKVELKVDTGVANDRKVAFEESLGSMLRPEPNAKILGWRWKLSLWNMGGGPDTTTNFIRRWLRRQGEKPVLLSDVNREYNENLLRNRLENRGFFNASFSSDTSINGKLATVTYYGIPRRIYRINVVKFDIDSTRQIGKDISETRDKSLLRNGKNYNLDVIINERERIDDDLKNQGYYYFSPDNLLVEVDSTIGDHKVNMYVNLKPETSEKSIQPQKIGNIFIYPDYTLNTQGYQRQSRPRNLELFDNNYYIVDRNKTYRRKVLTNHIFFRRGELYNRWNHNQTINHLVNLNTFKFVKNNFEDNPDSTNTLDVYYYLTPLPKKSLRFEVLGKTATVYNGSEANVTWTLRNAFRGFETLTLNAFGGYETQTGGNVNLNSSYYRYGAEVAITWPRLLSPYKWAPSRRYIPRTYLKLGYEFLNRRTAYTLNSTSLNYGYNWKEDDRKQHDLALAEIIYVQPRNVTPEYEAQMDTVPTLRHIIEPQFSFGPNYNFTYTNTMQQEKKHTFYFKGGINLSGNVLGLIQAANIQKGNTKTLFNTVYSQFIKVEGDFRYYMKLSPNSQLASRIMIGTSYSYGNSRSLPYLKQYFTGGPNGLRAFQARSVGPGSSLPENLGRDNFFADQTGDYKLELNTEYRAKIAGFLHWAAFVDAGNIWLQNRDDNKPGGRFSKEFLSELAVGGGAGLRFDFDFLILRTDFAIPFRIPHNTKSDRWVFQDIDFGSGKWRENNLIFNLAIGYPF
ncbi:translocation and assembly module lipoprotein TamL [Sphingobacterium lumbrici]|uniref:translocation and assembly module lipoprotein TamL n=1 Tax=Sphingobacterium lumbrici TaxID=2559600 RepID=UPI00112E33AB|nr:BamA/TamA family outer membrane protein [Sphingobacterium lumbrici]